MEASFFAQAAKFLREKRQNKRWMAIFLCSAILVAGVTVAALRLYGQAMTHQVKTLECSAEVHEHVEECYDEDENLICGYSDYLIHVHNDDCYNVNGELVCPLPEIKPHEHTEECYQEQRVLTCGQEETAGHQHDGTCYAMGENVLTCTLEEHTHGDSCYSQEKVLVCGKEESEEHVHTEECYALERGALTCGMEEHTHNENCYGQAEELVCGLEEGAGGHTHTDACYGVERVLVCGEDETVLHTHGEDCFDEEGNLICGLVQLEEHVHGEGCFRIMELTNEEIEILNKNSQTSGGEKVCEGEGYVVTATYGADANIPEGAELKAELITPEEDPEHYAQREEEFQQTLGDEEVAMSALFRIGFYVDGEEIEPRSAVTVTVQFLDENGLADGEPITVVHFAEEGTEVLDGSDAEDNSTTFEMESFSEIAIGRRGMGKLVEISQDFAYADEEFRINFHVEGKARLAEDATGAGNAVESGDAQDGAAPEEGGTTEEEAGAGEEAEETETGSDAAETETEMMEEVTVPRASAGTDIEEDTAQDGEESIEETFQDEESADDVQGSEEDTGEGQEPGTGVETPVADVQQIPGSEDPAFLLEVAHLDENSQEFAAISKCAREVGIDGGVPLALKGMSLSLSHNGQEVSLEKCQITAEVSPTEALVKQATEEGTKEDGEERDAFRIQVFGVGKDNEAVQLNDLSVSKEDALNESAQADLDTPVLGATISEYKPLNFTVQYYAKIQVLDENPAGKENLVGLDFIDTSKETGLGGTPGNTLTMPVKIVYLDKSKVSAKGTVAEVCRTESLEKIYSDLSCEFSRYPKLENFNKFSTWIDETTKEERSSNYDLAEIWVLKEGGKEESAEEGDWDKYSKDAKITNNPQYKNDPNVIVIEDGTVIRLVGSPKEGDKNYGANFYDYDITDGKVYTGICTSSKLPNSPTGWTETKDRNYAGTLYAYAKNQGINATGDFKFGNSFAEVNNVGKKNGSVFINRANKEVFGGCSFGLVGQELVTIGNEGCPQFNVTAPDLFSSNVFSGKTAVSFSGTRSDLMFRKEGDTYTLTEVKDTTKAQNLDKFELVYQTSAKRIWSNQFWPMDDSSTWGTDDHDMKFGAKGIESKRKAYTGYYPNNLATFNVSDDFQDHNSFFGMRFSLDFKLTKDYEGPLNYYFYGDDDMWVFLDGKKLICDIGGVHSSVGEYVNLWDYIDKGTEGTHVLDFFYTERGASGSSCWMQFTLPEAASRPVSAPAGSIERRLTVTKTVTGEQVETDQAFPFSLELLDVKGVPLMDLYPYRITGKDGKTVEDSGRIKHGDSFALKNGWAIEVLDLPDGATYTIVEAENAGYASEINGTVEADRTATGTIDYKVKNDVAYNNVVVGYALPETGGIGTKTIRMAALLQIMIAAALLGYKQTRRRKGGMGR